MRPDLLYPQNEQRSHDDVIKWKHFPCYWPFVRGIYRSPVNSPHKRQWRRALMVSLICAWINGWVNNREAGDLRRHRAHYDITAMFGLGRSDLHVIVSFTSSTAMSICTIIVCYICWSQWKYQSLVPIKVFPIKSFAPICMTQCLIFRHKGVISLKLWNIIRIKLIGTF